MMAYDNDWILWTLRAGIRIVSIVGDHITLRTLANGYRSFDKVTRRSLRRWRNHRIPFMNLTYTNPNVSNNL